MEKKDYYSILGVDRNASQDDIKKAFRQLTVKWHPDKWVNASESEKKHAEEQFKEINEAHAVLSDPEKRAKYDQFGDASFEGMPFNPFVDLDELFNLHRRQQSVPRGSNINVSVEITMEESYNGGEKKINVPKDKLCSHCNGTGDDSGKSAECPYCHGTGKISQTNRNGNNFVMFQTPCPHCNGTGKIISNPCRVCGGSGIVREFEEMTIMIPPGVWNGAKIGIDGEGNAPLQGNGIKGSLIITFIVKPREGFDRDGFNLIAYLDLNLKEAWLGCEKIVYILNGESVKVKVPELTEDGKEFVFYGRGFSNSEGTGNLIVKVRYVVPTSLTTKQKKLLNDFYDV